MIKFKIESIHSPRWSSKDGTSIDCIVKFSHLLEEHEFTASLYDIEEHGREIWEQCSNGMCGEILSYAPRDNTQTYQSVESPPLLKHLDEFFNEVNSENSKHSFRSVVIDWGSVIDETLHELLHKLSETNTIKNSSYNNLHTKSEAVLKLGFIDENDKTRCDCIRHIRNEAAHNWKLTLENEKMSLNLKQLYQLDHSDTFHYIEDLDFLLQNIYSGSAALLLINLQNQIQKIQKNQKT